MRGWGVAYVVAIRCNWWRMGFAPIRTNHIEVNLEGYSLKVDHLKACIRNELNLKQIL